MPDPAEPFAIATLPLAGDGRTGGGRIGVCRLPRLPEDLPAILGWKPAAVLSMTEVSEMAPCRDLGRVLAEAGIAWLHLPIRDFFGPDGASRDAWPETARRLHAILDGGGGVLLHCRGGKGRSGMIALRLMAERGEPADAALARLRQARPGAVETAEQLAWAEADTG